MTSTRRSRASRGLRASALLRWQVLFGRADRVRDRIDGTQLRRERQAKLREKLGLPFLADAVDGLGNPFERLFELRFGDLPLHAALQPSARRHALVISSGAIVRQRAA